MICVGFAANLIMLLHPMVAELRVYWLPVLEEAAKAFLIVRSGEISRLEWIRVSAIFGIVDGLSRMAVLGITSNEAYSELNFSVVEAIFLSLVVGVSVVCLHAFFALFYFRRLSEKWFIFMLPPLFVHLIWNWSRNI